MVLGVLHDELELVDSIAFMIRVDSISFYHELSRLLLGLSNLG